MAGRPGDRVRTRRRGAVLENAIRQAVFAELFEVGYAALTMEAVAARAGSGKAPLYRRWANKRDMVIDTISGALPRDDDQVADTGGLRADLIRLLGSMVATMHTVPGRAMNTLIEERHRHPELADAVIKRLIEPRLSWVAQAIRHAVAQGEIPAPTSVDVVARAGPAMILQHELQYGQIATEADIADIVDIVLLPALGAR
jgi:AcrR family transcriptional regulator